ncbi:hypothetical protein C0J52_17360 [Blattella germanica]|nr:hypothetical protein C0J52_17360 [Blattella germanica]
MQGMSLTGVSLFVRSSVWRGSRRHLPSPQRRHLRHSRSGCGVLPGNHVGCDVVPTSVSEERVQSGLQMLGRGAVAGQLEEDHPLRCLLCPALHSPSSTLALVRRWYVLGPFFHSAALFLLSYTIKQWQSLCF